MNPTTITGLEPTCDHLPDAPPAVFRGPWVMHVACISTAHLPQDTFDRLAEIDPQGYVGKVFGLGALMRCGELDEFEDLPDEALNRVYRFTMRAGYSWVRFDPDGDIFRELPVWNW